MPPHNEITELRIKVALLEQTIEGLQSSNRFLTEEVNRLSLGDAVLKNSIKIYVGVIATGWGIFGTVLGFGMKAIFHL